MLAAFFPSQRKVISLNRGLPPPPHHDLREKARAHPRAAGSELPTAYLRGWGSGETQRKEENRGKGGKEEKGKEEGEGRLFILTTVATPITSTHYS